MMRASTSPDLPFRQVVIIGAGFGGLVMACELNRKLNFNDFVIYERNSGIGGTWHENNYPGAAADIPGAAYQISFAPEPNFSRIFPVWSELNEYMLNVARRYQISQHVRSGMAWVGSAWLEESKTWRIQLQNTDTGDISFQDCKVLVSATGHMIDPKRFDVKGKQDFQRRIVHSSKWSADIDLKGKNVVVVGNGSTAVQLVPALLKDVQKCTQIQRAPQWILNRQNPCVPEIIRRLLTWFPFLFSFLSALCFLVVESFYHVLGNRIPQMSKKHMKDCGVPQKYHPLLTPSYPPGCKRLVFAAEYLQCLKNPKIELVQDEIVSLSKKSVITKLGNEYPCDLLILAHGFESESFNLPLKGRDGISPEEHWKTAGGPSCYKGIAMHGFPNFFMIRGPNMASGHNSVIWYIEATTALILNVAGPLIKGKMDLAEIKEDAELEYVRAVQAACQKGVWGSGCHTYYVNESGWNHTMYPWNSYSLWFFRFWKRKDWILSE
ncbi:hypothetical protein BDV95DRAFT_281774 [Massariosphaeria phaeospora]|uniref:FAD/NAD(P)-binding domain-containing protein n=1 Tax=Massariosphaeria phaeospora TaxID=100035 RepID=A0A7C8IJE8_9PLEO|nr:hypothetical protein BDV95DRAFT_281774 [Massariosphaeria phaeospora]